jgi:hypothetical protein
LLPIRPLPGKPLAGQAGRHRNQRDRSDRLSVVEKSGGPIRWILYPLDFIHQSMFRTPGSTEHALIRRDLFEVAGSRDKSPSLRDTRFSAIGH